MISELMYLLELIMPFTTRATLIQIRQDIFVVASAAHGQGTLIVGASVKYSTITNTT